VRSLVLAAGRGTRLTAASGGLPKPLVPVAGTTPLEHALSWIAEYRPERIWVNVHAGAELIRRRIGARVGSVPVLYSYEPELLGTAGAWKNLETEWRRTSLVVYGDNVMRFDLQRLLKAHASHGAIVTVAVFDPVRHDHTGIAGGRVELKHHVVTRFVEGGNEGLINAGAYCVEPALGARLRSGFLDFGQDVLPRLAAAGLLAAHVIEEGGYCLGVDTPARLRLARRIRSERLVTP
jgi:mannose-1-phosphate guanylyltransferase